MPVRYPAVNTARLALAVDAVRGAKQVAALFLPWLQRTLAAPADAIKAIDAVHLLDTVLGVRRISRQGDRKGKTEFVCLKAKNPL